MAKRVRAEEGGDREEETKILRETVLSIALLKEGWFLFLRRRSRSETKGEDKGGVGGRKGERR